MRLFHLFFIFMFFTTIGCNKFEDFVEPISNCDELQLGESRIFVNANESDFQLTLWPMSEPPNTFNLWLSKDYVYPEDGSTFFEINHIPLAIGKHTEIKSESFAKSEDITMKTWSFSIEKGRLAEYTIKLGNDEFIEILEINAAEQEIKGRFAFRAKRFSSNGYSQSDIDLPKRCTIEGKFSFIL